MRKVQTFYLRHESLDGGRADSKLACMAALTSDSTNDMNKKHESADCEWRLDRGKVAEQRHDRTHAFYLRV